ncbi:MAG TPA: glycosyltransferase [Candidatus Polarisedimenticolia bacterium]|nr:glycosyltransferase [Candidatus Polarisedimenticolia bacterium]
MPGLDDYRDIVGADTLDELHLLAGRLTGRSLLNVNSTAVGGGVAEILSRMVPLMRELGLDARWEVIRGGEAFHAATKRFHNALHGAAETVTAGDYEAYDRTLRENLPSLNLDADIVFIHDPQPAGLVQMRNGSGHRWIWRCHIDLSRPDPDVWEFFRPYVERYDACVFSAPAFARSLPIPQALISPSIDPLSDKNRELEGSEVDAILQRLELPTDRALVTQVSRFDRLKDPLGVIEAFRLSKASAMARLVLVGGPADDDPEGAQVLAEVRERAQGDDSVRVLCLPPTSHLEINAIQRASTIIVQKSLREGFGLTVSEALWKGKPVIAGSVGGLPNQIGHKHSGILTHSIEGTAYWIKHLLKEPAYANWLGANGRESVRQHFLLTRQLRDYLLLVLYLEGGEQDFIRLPGTTD